MKVVVTGDECGPVIEATLRDERISEIGSTSAFQNFGSKETGSFPKSFSDGKRGDFKNGLPQGRTEMRVAEEFCYGDR